MSEQFDQLMQAMSELTETVKGRAGDPTLDMDALTPVMEKTVNELVEQRVKAAFEAQPVRRGQAVEANGAQATVKTDNRYHRLVNDLKGTGKTRLMGETVKAADLWLAYGILDRRRRELGEVYDGKKTGPSKDLEEAVKALTSSGAGTGDELVPTDMSDQIWDDVFLASRVVGSMNSIGMTSNPMDVPLAFGSMTWRKGTENTAVTVTDPATAKSTLTATELVAEVNWSYTLDEDAIVAVAPLLRQRIAQSGAEIIDDFALNADATNAATGNINLDDADPDDDSYYLSNGQDGIIHQWLVDNTSMTTNAGGDALTDADITATLALMDKYAVNPMDCVIVTGAATWFKGFMALTTVIGADQIGMDNVILTGQLGSYRGIPIVVSASHRKAEADGKLSTTGSNNTLGRISIFNRNTWLSGFRRNLLIETDRDIQKRQMITVCSIRQALASRGTRSTNTHTAGIRNILV